MLAPTDSNGFPPGASPGAPGAWWKLRESIFQPTSALREWVRGGSADEQARDLEELLRDLERSCTPVPSRALAAALPHVRKAVVALARGSAAAPAVAALRQSLATALGRLECLAEAALLGAPPEREEALAAEIARLCAAVPPPVRTAPAALRPRNGASHRPPVAPLPLATAAGAGAAPAAEPAPPSAPPATAPPDDEGTAGPRLTATCARLLDELERNPHDRSVLERLTAAFTHLGTRASSPHAAAEARSAIELITSVLSGEALVSLDDLLQFLRLCVSSIDSGVGGREETATAGAEEEPGVPAGGGDTGPAATPPTGAAPSPAAPPGITMVTMDGVYRRIVRAVRGEAAQQGKLLDLRFHGGDIRVPRPVAAMLPELLLELARNAVRHGLESPHGRALAGKYPRGTVEIRARLETAGGILCLEVQDNGGGIDEQRVRMDALASGLTELEEDLPEVLVALARARRSGLARVFDVLVAGGGMLQVETEPGLGTTFRLLFPLASGAELSTI